MATEKDFELLDDYLSNRLGGEEKIDFEKRLEMDDSLRNELHLQRDLVEGIKMARIAELKGILNQTVIPPNTTSTIAVKTSLWIVAAIVVGTGLYYLINQESEVVAPEQQTIVNEETIPGSQQAVEDDSQIDKSMEEVDSILADKTETTTGDIEQEKSAQPTQPVTVQPIPVRPPSLDPYDPTEELDGDSDKPEIMEEITPSSITTSSILVETDNTNKKLDFHYQFNDGKLFLFGSFEKDLYEILEFFNNNQRTVFLYYNSNFYLLDEAQIKPVPLKPIADQSLIQKLSEYRRH